MIHTDTRTLEATRTGENPGPDALFRLGLRYCNGHDVPRDLVEAHKWFNLAAMGGDSRARQYRGEISREMTPAQIAEAQRQARSWLTSH